MKKPLTAWLFLMPMLLLLVVFMAYPVFYGVLLSLYKWDGIMPKVFFGVKNFVNLYKDPLLAESLKNNVVYSFWNVLMTCGAGLLFAILLSGLAGGRNFYRAVFYMPVMTSMVVIGILSSRILEPNYGLVNSMLRFAGLDHVARSWLGDPETALFSIILVSAWQFIGFPMIIYLTAIMSIPKEIYESSIIDGVRPLQKAFYVTIPMIKIVVLEVVMLQMIWSFKAFDIIYVMTKGGPGTSTYVLGILLYNNAFWFSNLGYASSIAVFMLLTISLLAVLYRRLVKIDGTSIQY